MGSRNYGQPFLIHYKLSDPFPVEWPAGKDDSDGSDHEDAAHARAKAQAQAPSRRKSVYSILERPSHRYQGRPPESVDVEPEHVDPMDERDPLGSNERVMDLLRRRGLPVEDDAQLRV
jgi:exocyst complex component 2